MRVQKNRVDPERLVEGGALALEPKLVLRVREPEETPRSEQEVVVQLLRQLEKHPMALLVEGDGLWRLVVRPDDRRVAPGTARADVRPFEHCYVADAVPSGQIVRDCQAVSAATDDDDVVVGLEVVHPEMDALPQDADHGEVRPGPKSLAWASTGFRSAHAAMTRSGT